MSFVTKIWDILEELLEYFGNAKMIIYVSLALMAITLITHLLFKKIRIIKYLPGLIVVGIGAYNFYEVKDLLTAETSLSDQKRSLYYETKDNAGSSVSAPNHSH